jgi:NAD(P)-dependent dehydrogenase (short-subunit alcohol dehydrogenase family)
MLAPIMAKTGGGAIVNVSSLGGLMPVPYCPAYAATKAGVLGLTRSFASALPQGVRVTAMLPDFVDTPMTANAPLRGKVPILAPMDLARGIVHVASDASAKGAFYSVRSSENGPVLLRVPDEPQFLPAETTPF